ncbi:MAG: Glycerate kinase [Verrucomicrobiota bacterium]|jgi:glycerate kinase
MKPMAVLIACDKFKGTLTAGEACAALRDGLLSCWPGLDVRICPIADGGEGTADALRESGGGEWRVASVRGPLGNPVRARWVWFPELRRAALEMSEASGLKLVAEEDRDPWQAGTRGTGELMRAAMQAGAEQMTVGIGGSATNDGGAGMAAALGYRFLDADGREIDPVPAGLGRLEAIVSPDRSGWPEVTAACDVTNPLLGSEGATRVYGAQKGVRPDQVSAFEAGLERLADVAARDLGRDCRALPGAGAAGGLGFGLMTFCGAVMKPGFELVAEANGLAAAVAAADVVFTGEGCLDRQTLHGKGPMGVAALARAQGKPVIAVGGIVEQVAMAALTGAFDAVVAAAGPTTLEAALRDPAGALRRVVPAHRAAFARMLGLEG